MSKNHLMRLAAERHRVLWVNSIGYRAPKVNARDMRRVAQKLRAVARERLKRVEDNIWTLSPLVLPAYGSSALGSISRYALARQVRGAMRQLGFVEPINWVFNPTASTVAGRLGESLLVYYCVDDYLHIEGVDHEAVGQLEDQLLTRADVVVASTAPLCETKTRGERRPILIPHGVQYDHFRTTLEENLTVASEVADLPGPVFGYFGLMSHDWFDCSLIEAIADKWPQGSVVLIGKSTMDLGSVSRRSNVQVLGQKPFAELPRYCKGFDAALLPFPLTELTRAANPLKVREYLAAGLPVVSTSIPEVESIGSCFIGDGPEGFVQAARAALEDSTTPRERSRRMAAQSWRARYEQVEALLSSHLRASSGK